MEGIPHTPAVILVHGSGPMSRDGVMRGQIGLGFGFDLPVYPDPRLIKPEDVGHDLSPSLVEEIVRFLDAHASRGG